MYNIYCMRKRNSNSLSNWNKMRLSMDRLYEWFFVIIAIISITATRKPFFLSLHNIGVHIDADMLIDSEFSPGL